MQQHQKDEESQVMDLCRKKLEQQGFKDKDIQIILQTIQECKSSMKNKTYSDMR